MTVQRFDVYTDFARSFLHSRECRAVYFTFIAQTAPSWTASDLAAKDQLDVADVQTVLDAFEGTGIVERRDGTGGIEYVWRADMEYLYGSGTEVFDPVCGMRVSPNSPFEAEASGRRWRFCAAVCLAAFLDAPPREVTPQTQARTILRDSGPSTRRRPPPVPAPSMR